jgi:uncharacterized membrane protein
MSLLSGRTITGLLIGSVIFNLLLAGAIVGRFFLASPSLRSFPPTMGWVLRGLPPEERETIRPLLAEHMQGTVAAQRALAHAQRKASLLMREDHLDEKALAQAFAELRDASRDSQETMHRALIEVMVAISPEQRRQVIGYMRGGWRGETGRRPGERGGNRPGEQDRMPPPRSPDPADTPPAEGF